MMTTTEMLGAPETLDTGFSCIVHDGPGIDNALSMTTYSATSTNTYYYLTDHLGSVHALASTNGAIVESYKYDAWGRVLGVYDGNGTPLTESAVGNRILWQGREYSWRTGLYYFRARWYDPVTGRFISNDPIGISGGLNQYVFAGNNPVNRRDPSGKCTDTPTTTPNVMTTPTTVVPNPSGHGEIVYSSQVSFFLILGGAGGTEVVRLDNGEYVTYGYLAGGAGLGEWGGAIQHGSVFNVYDAGDYTRSFINFSGSFWGGVSGSVTPGGGAYSGTYGAGSPGFSGAYQYYWIVNRSSTPPPQAR